MKNAKTLTDATETTCIAAVSASFKVNAAAIISFSTSGKYVGSTFVVSVRFKASNTNIVEAYGVTKILKFNMQLYINMWKTLIAMQK